VTKVRNMEEVGFAMGIIVDDTQESIEDVIMSDDGTGDGITIPSVLISQKEWKTLITYLTSMTE